MALMKQARSAALLVMLALWTAGCETPIPPEALNVSQQTVGLREMQSRRFDTTDEKKILSACADLLQDLGFNIEDTCSDLGLVVASKDRSAVDSGQVAGSVIIAVLFGANTPYDKWQRFRASIVTRPAGDGKAIIVRVTFQRTVWNTENFISRNEQLNKPEQYQKFFEKLSKAVFLQANNL